MRGTGGACDATGAELGGREARRATLWEGAPSGRTRVRRPAGCRRRGAGTCTGLTALGGRSWHTLSGGERQRAQLARALAREPRELLLDEPTNHLGIQDRLGLLDLVAGLPVTTVVALHDLNLAAMSCARLLVLRDGHAVAEGSPAEVLTPALIEDVYGVRAEVTHEPGHPVIRFLRRTGGRPGPADTGRDAAGPAPHPL